MPVSPNDNVCIDFIFNEMRSRNWIMKKQQENICCPNLMIIKCTDTQEHKHLICGDNEAIISNETAKDLCIDDYKKCVLNLT